MRSSTWFSLGLLAVTVSMGVAGCSDDDDDGGATTAGKGGGSAGKGGTAGGGGTDTGNAGEPGGGSAPVGGEPSGGSAAGGASGADAGGVTGEGGAAGAAASTDVELHNNIFTDADGFSLYLREGDTASTTDPVSACAAPCAAWPVFAVEDPTVPAELDAADFRVFDGDNGTQATYKGWPLYYFSGDLAPGATNGDGLGGIWHLVKLPFVAP